MRQRTTIAALCFAAGALAGCGSTDPAGFERTDFQVPAAQVIRVESRSETHVVYVDRRSGEVSAIERGRLTAFIADLGGSRREALHVEVTGSENPEHLQHVGRLLTGAGVVPGKIRLKPARLDAQGGPPGSDAVTVVAERGFAVPPDCPGWFAHISAPEDNKVDPNFGCANVNNLAVMVADPKDLEKGQSTPYADGERAAGAVRDYRANKVIDLNKPTLTILKK